MYEWSFCIYGYVIIGRTWEEFIELYKGLSNRLNTSLNNRLIIYVHNLSYEFQFIRKRFEWESVFSLKERKPIKATTIEGVEFRCSYLLSGYSLETLAKTLKTYKIRKLKGDLDYRIIRTSTTPLSEEELQYCINDVLIVVCYIDELIKRRGDITKIPLTKTGFVRDYCRKNCLYKEKGSDKYHKYRKLMKSLTLNEDEYILCRRAFSGGFTHANSQYVKIKLPNVRSFDECSAYPSVMIAEKFPMSRPELYNPLDYKDFVHTLTTYCCMFYVKFTNIKSKIPFENYISKSHCYNLKNGKFNNGRVVCAEELVLAVTEQDYMIIYKTYEWENSEISNLYRFRRGYLPTELVKSILDLYNTKTKLKGVKGQEEIYMESKEELNSCYGMAVTDICRDEIKYDIEWSKVKTDIKEAMSKNNKSIKRFLYYPWGVWVTAYARRNLWEAILEFGEDYIYSDTDSVKVLNYKKHLHFIEEYNKRVSNQLDIALKYHNLDIELTRPKTIEGKVKQLGAWEDEGEYKYFKTLGAKRYMINKKGALELPDETKYDFSITVAGLNKFYTVPYLIEEYGEENMFSIFEENLYIPKDKTGKLTHTYIDEEKLGKIKDYLGNYGYYHEYSAIHLEPADYSLDLTQEFLDYIFEMQEE